MTAIKTVATILAAALLGACTASPVAPILAPAKAAPVRHVQAVDASQGNGATFWGLNFDHETVDQVYTAKCDDFGRILYWYYVTKVDLSYHTTGAGEFKYLGNGRVRYTVPDGLALHVTEMSGTLVWVNGVAVGPGLATVQVPMSAYYLGSNSSANYYTAAQTVGRVPVDYVFGPGEDIMFAAAPGSTLAGTVGDPSYFGGRSGPAAK